MQNSLYNYYLTAKPKVNDEDPFLIELRHKLVEMQIKPEEELELRRLAASSGAISKGSHTTVSSIGMQKKIKKI